MSYNTSGCGCTKSASSHHTAGTSSSCGCTKKAKPTCPSSCSTSSLFESTREARLEAIAKAKREEEARREQIARLNGIRQSIAVRDAKEQARFQALQEAERSFKIRERDILEKQLEDTLAAQKRMQDQYQEFVTTTAMIAEKLNNPANLFKTSTIVCVDEFDDYFKLTYKDGRTVNVPFGVIDFMLKSKLCAINEMFDQQARDILQLQTDVADQGEQAAKMADLFKTLVTNVATHETDQQAEFAKFKCEVTKKIDSLTSDVNSIVVSFKNLVELVDRLTATVNSVVESA